MSEQEIAAELQEAQETVAPQSVARAHEVHDVNLRAIAIFAVALVLTVIVSVLLLRWLLGAWSTEPLTPDAQIVPALTTAPAAPGPGIEALPALELQRVLGPQQERLRSYGWIDERAGAVYLPIERAMELLLAEGLPSADVEPPAFGLPPAYTLDGSGGQEQFVYE